MALRVRDVLSFPELNGVRALAPVGLDRQIRWVHTWPEVLPWLHGGELLLTTAYSWPPDPQEQRRIVRELHQAGVAAILFRAGGEFFAATPPAVAEEASRAGLAVLEVTEDVSFVDLAETINRAIIRTHFESLERSERIHRELTEAALEAQAVSDIQSRLEGLLGRKVFVLDPRGRLLAGDETLARRLLGSLSAFQPSGQEAVTVLEDGTALLRRPVRTGTAASADLVLVAGPGEPFRNVDVRAAQHAALVMGLHFLRQQAVADAEARVRSTFVEAVLQGRLGSDRALQERAQLLGFNVAGSHAVAVVVSLGPEGRASLRPLHSTEDFQARHRLGQAAEQALRSLQLPVFLAYELNQVVLLLPADVPPARRTVSGSSTSSSAPRPPSSPRRWPSETSVRPPPAAGEPRGSTRHLVRGPWPGGVVVRGRAGAADPPRLPGPRGSGGPAPQHLGSAAGGKPCPGGHRQGPGGEWLQPEGRGPCPTPPLEHPPPPGGPHGGAARRPSGRPRPAPTAPLGHRVGVPERRLVIRDGLRFSLHRTAGWAATG